MEIRGATEKMIRMSARLIQAKCARWRATAHGFAFVLRPEGGTCKYTTRGHNGRRINALCWHGHKAFMDHVFASAPEATIITTITTYRGVEDYARQLVKGADPRKGFSTTFNCKHEG